MVEQKIIFDGGNQLAAYAAKQINYHVMGYFPITPSTEIAEHLDLLKAEGLHDVKMIPADGEHGAAGICYGACVGGGRVFNASSANGLLYALEQFPVQSGTRMPMVMNIACRIVSGPLSIKGDQSDIMYTLNTGWVTLYAETAQAVYDMNIIGLKVAERVRLPLIVGFDGFFTSHQKRRTKVMAKDEDVQHFVGSYQPEYTALDTSKPATFGSYMNEPDIINNKYQLHLAMEEAREAIEEVFTEYEQLTGRSYNILEKYQMDDAEVGIFVLGSAFGSVKVAVDKLRAEGKKVGVFTTNVIRPWPSEHIYNTCKDLKSLVILDRQDSYGAGGGNMSLEIKATLQDYKSDVDVISRVYGLSGKDFYVEDAEEMFKLGLDLANGKEVKKFDYYGQYKGKEGYQPIRYFDPLTEEELSPDFTKVTEDKESNTMSVKGGLVKDSTAMPKRIVGGHGACPGCGIPVNLNLLLKGLVGHVVLLFHTGCGMVTTTGYPKTAFRTTYVHNLFQNGAATLSGIVEAYHEKQRRGEIPKDEEITFVMVTGDGGLDIGMGPAIGAALRNHKMIIFEYDNGGYMNTGYQLSYQTPKGARTSTSHLGKAQDGKETFTKDSPQIFAATNIPYIATVAESHPADFIKKAAKAQQYANKYGLVFMKAISACPLNWGDDPRYERNVIEYSVNSCFHPLYEIENGITKITYNPEKNKKKVDVLEFYKLMGRTRHLMKEEYKYIMDSTQEEVDRRWERLKAMDEHPLL
ncbi:MAG: pyruvate synthase [Epulopiscium sp.]|nr:pyruvate synthase [Candidatus Epulonipiscium sp.]